MFSFLSKLESEDSIAAIHSAIRILKHRYSFSYGHLPSSIRKNALQIITEILKKEKKELKELSEKRIEEYISILSDTAQSYAKKRFQFDPIRGKKLITELRRIPLGEAVVFDHVKARKTNRLLLNYSKSRKNTEGICLVKNYCSKKAKAKV